MAEGKLQVNYIGHLEGKSVKLIFRSQWMGNFPRCWRRCK
jgi:hypothetical protein